MNRLLLIVTIFLLTANGLYPPIGLAESHRKTGKQEQSSSNRKPNRSWVRSNHAIARRPIQFQPPPPPDAPTRRPRGTASRGRCNTPSFPWTPDPTLTLLVPESNWGLTDQEFPTLWVAVTYPQGQTEAEPVSTYTLELRAMDDTQSPHPVNVQIPRTSGTFKLPLPVSLQPRQGYRVYLVQKCDAPVSGVSDLVMVESYIQRVDVNIPQLPQMPTSPEARIASYAERGIWFDAFHEAAQLACTHPSKTQMGHDYWQTLLRDNAVNLDNIADRPLLCE